MTRTARSVPPGYELCSQYGAGVLQQLAASNGPLTIFREAGGAILGPGKSGGAGMAQCPLQMVMAWGVLPPARSV
jgi:hypothetical protein